MSDAGWAAAKRAEHALSAEEWWIVLEELVRVGFTREEALRIACRPSLVVPQAQVPPEFMEMAQRMTALINRDALDG